MKRFAMRHSFWAGLVLAFAAARSLPAADAVPKAETILDKYIEVTGGKAAYAKIHTEISTGVMDFAAMGLKGKMVSYAADPDKRVMEVTLDGMGKLLDGSNGEIAWATNAMQGPHLKDGDEKNEALLESRFNADAHWREIYQSAENAGIENVDGKQCYKIVLTPKTGNPVTKWYDKQSNLMVKMKVKAKTAMGEIESESEISDYRKEDGILMPHKVVSHVATMVVVLTVESVKHNAEIPDDKFELPDEIKALLKKPQR